MEIYACSLFLNQYIFQWMNSSSILNLLKNILILCRSPGNQGGDRKNRDSSQKVKEKEENERMMIVNIFITL